MFDNPRNLLDQITLAHGPHDVLGQYFVMADDMARESGVRLRLRTDFGALMDLNRENRDTWHPLPPIYDPAHSNLRIDTAFWLDGVDDRGETVVTYFARLFDFTDSNLVDELRSLRVFYENPQIHVATGESVTIDHPRSLTHVRGRTTYGGGMWVRRDWRGCGFPKYISRICSAYAHTRWNCAYSWGFVVPRAHRLGLSRAYGPYAAVEGVTLKIGLGKDLPMMLLWMTNETMLADLARQLDRAPIHDAGQRDPHDVQVVARTGPR